MKLGSYLTPLTKINLKWVKDLKIGSETVNLLEENIGKKFLDTGIVNDFLDIAPKAQSTKAKISGNYIKIKSFCTVKEIIIKM